MEFNLSDLYRQVFGYKGLPGSFSGLTVNEATAEQRSVLGTPLFMPTRLNGWQLPNEPLVTLSGTKTIIKTKFDGQNGSFKENFDLDDYTITIRGLIIDESNPDVYPQALVRKLRTVFEEKKSIEIANDLLTIFNIKLISIESLELDSAEGMPGVQPYVITGVSDREFDLEYKRKNVL